MARNDNSGGTGGKKPNWLKQVSTAYTMTRQTDPAVTKWMLLAAGGVLALIAIIALLTGSVLLPLMFGLPFVVLAAMLVLVRRAEAAAYVRIADQPGASLSALNTVRTGSWTWEDEPVDFNAKTGEMVFRGVGRPGVLLVSEGGSDTRAQRLFENEIRRVKRVVPEVPITTVRIGHGEDQVKLTKLSRHVTKLSPVLSKEETAAVSQRLKTLGAKKMPIPKGVDPFSARPNRKALRGR